MGNEEISSRGGRGWGFWVKEDEVLKRDFGGKI